MPHLFSTPQKHLLALSQPLQTTRAPTSFDVLQKLLCCHPLVGLQDGLVQLPGFGAALLQAGAFDYQG